MEEISTGTYLWNEREKLENSCDIILIIEGKRSMAHSFVLKPACGLFNTTSLPTEKVDNKEMMVANIDKLLEVESLSTFEVELRVKAFETILEFVYEQRSKIPSPFMAEAVLLTAHFIMCGRAFEWAADCLSANLRDTTEAIHLFKFLVEHDVADSNRATLLREKIKRKIAAHFNKYIYPSSEDWMELFFLKTNVLKQLLENVVFDAYRIEKLLILDGSQYSNALLELEFDAISIWWKTEAFKEYNKEEEKFNFAMAWVSGESHKHRQKLLLFLLECVDFSSLSLPVAAQMVSKSQVMLGNPAAQSLWTRFWSGKKAKSRRRCYHNESLRAAQHTSQNSQNSNEGW